VSIIEILKTFDIESIRSSEISSFIPRFLMTTKIKINKKWKQKIVVLRAFHDKANEVDADDALVIRRSEPILIRPNLTSKSPANPTPTKTDARARIKVSGMNGVNK
jgi:hypothetical protein